MKGKNTLAWGILFLIMILIQACGKAEQAAEPSAIAPCDAKDCFITKANDCEEVNITVSENFGTVSYASSGCVFTKTMQGVSANETAEIRELFDGKSLTCTYEKGNFDPRWINSLVFGIEYCQGDLKDRIVDMLAFV